MHERTDPADRKKDTFYCYIQGFTPERAKLSPGTMVVGAVIEDAIRRRAKRIDFLRGREAYKYAWGTTDRETFRRTLALPSGRLNEIRAR